MSAETTVTVERVVAGVGYFKVRDGARALGDIRGARSLGFEAGPPGLSCCTSHRGACLYGTYATRDEAVAAIVAADGAPVHGGAA